MLKPLHPILVAVQFVLFALGILAMATVAPDNVPKSLMFVGIGIAVTFVVSQMRSGASVQLGSYGWVFCLLALVAVLFIGREINGVKRWILIGGFQFQPSEFAKVALIAYFASFFARRGSRHGLIFPFVALGATTGFILLAPSISAAVFTFLLGLGVMFIAQVPLGRIISIAITAGLLASPFIGVVIGQHKYIGDRISGFNETLRTDDLCYKPDKTQVEFARCFIERGGVWGRGPAQAKWKLFAETDDFVSSTVAHSLGLLGITTIFAAFACILWIGLDLLYRLSRLQILDVDERNAASILCGGGMLLLVAHAAINLAVTVGKFPNTGMTLPFVSDGGSSMITCAIAIGWMHAAYALLVKHEKVANPRKVSHRQSVAMQ